MICISLAQSSRTLVLADMLNASRQCDLIELRLDRFKKAPELGELIASKPKPVIISCRRQRDGGEWEATEEERLALLRQCIISKADYVEIELDVADKIRKYPPSQRVICYTNYEETPPDIDEIYTEALSKQPDVIKLVTLARTPEEAWPLVQILAHPPVPTVVVGLGKAGAMLTILGRKIGAPWAYAALERGMEAYPGQPTVADLEAVYHYASIQRSTFFIGVTGTTELARTLIAGLNASLVDAGRPERCLPMQVGEITVFRKILAAVRTGAVVVDEDHQAAMVGMAGTLESEAAQAAGCDLVVHQEKAWRGQYVLGRAAVRALEATLKDGTEAKPLAGRHVAVVGVNPLARAVAYAVKQVGGLPLIAARDRDKAHQLAEVLEARYVMFEGLYSTRHEVLIVCSEERQPTGKSHEEPYIHPAHLQGSLVVMDLTALPQESVVQQLAMERGCRVVSARRVVFQYLVMLARRLTGKEVNPEPIRKVLRMMTEE